MKDVQEEKIVYHIEREKKNSTGLVWDYLDTTSDEDVDKNEHPHWINAVLCRQKKKKRSKDFKHILLSEKKKIVCQIDTGATFNRLPWKYAKHIKPYQGDPNNVQHLLGENAGGVLKDHQKPEEN